MSATTLSEEKIKMIRDARVSLKMLLNRGFSVIHLVSEPMSRGGARYYRAFIATGKEELQEVTASVATLAGHLDTSRGIPRLRMNGRGSDRERIARSISWSLFEADGRVRVESA